MAQNWASIPIVLWALLILLTIVLPGLWALRLQNRQHPKGTKIEMDEERMREPGRWTGWTRGPGGGPM